MNCFYYRSIVAIMVIGAVVMSSAPAFAKVLFLAHFNDSFNPVVAADKSQPTAHGKAENTGIGAGYPYEDSMPAVGGLNLHSGGFVGYPTAGNLRTDEGTIMFFVKLSHPYVEGPKIEYIFSIGNGPGTVDVWKNTIAISWGGWSNRLSCSIIDAEGKATGVTADTSFWHPDANWHQVVFSWSRSNRRVSLFIDGRLVDRKENVTTFPSQFSAKMFLGALNGWHEPAPHQYDELLILDQECDEAEAAAAYERKKEFPIEYKFNTTSLFRPLPLGDAATTPFADEQAADRKGGWTDQGSDTDRKDMPRGKVSLLGIPFVIGDRCIVLANSERDYYPKSKNISIGGRWEGLLFVQCGAWVMTPDKVCGSYEINYEDGSSLSVPLITEKNIGDWVSDMDIELARTVLPGTGGYRKKSGAFLFYWQNPHPEKTISSIDFRSSMDDAMPILIAISGVVPGAALSSSLNLLTGIRKNELARFTNLARTYRQAIKEMEAYREKLQSVKITDKQRLSFYGREAQRLLEEADIYLKEIAAWEEQLEKAIESKQYKTAVDLEKQLGYIRYLPGIIGRITKNLSMADNARLMTPLTVTAKAQSPVIPPSGMRYEIVLNGAWQSSTGTPDLCSEQWSQIIIPQNFNDKTQNRWLRRMVSIPAGTKKLRLRFECAPCITEVYINRSFAGRHIGQEPFDIDITDIAVPGHENEIMIFSAGKSLLYNGPDNGFSYPGSHTWNYGPVQDVILQGMPNTSVDCPYAWLDQDNQLHFWGKLHGASEQSVYSLEINMSHPNRQENFGPFVLSPDNQCEFKVSVPWANPLLWGIGGEYEAPNLFRVTYTLKRGTQIVDQHTFRTGFARFSVADVRYFSLNGHRLFLQGDHYWVSEGHEGATSRAFMMRYFRLLRDANFNITRDHHLGPGNTCNAALDVADELGFLLQPEAVNSGAPTMIRSRNYSDPVFRRNMEIYRRGIAMKLRTHPSVVIYSGSNEIFQTIDPLIEHSSATIVDMEKVFHEVAPHIQLTEQGSNWRKEFPTVDVHYSMGKAFSNWNKLGDRPAIHGEYNFMQGYYFDMQNPNPAIATAATKATAMAYKERIAYEKANGLAGTMPFPAFYMMGFSNASKSLQGPFADLLKVKDNKKQWYLPFLFDAWVKPAWPALSGRGRKVFSLRAGSQAENLNFWDAARVEYTPNDVYYAFKEAFDPMPSLPSTMSPEVIVTVSPADGTTPIWMEGPAMNCPEGVIPDAEGRAWFHLPQTGEYRFTGLGSKSITIQAKEFSLQQKPGFEYIQNVDLK